MAFVVEEKPAKSTGPTRGKNKPQPLMRIDWTEPKPANPDGQPAGVKRCSLRLGRVSRDMAETVKAHIEELQAATAADRPPVAKTVEWLNQLADDLHAKLAAVGLVAKRELADDPTDPARVKLFDFVDTYLAGRKDAKPRTLICFGQAIRWLKKFFPPDKRLADLTILDVEQWRSFQAAEGLAENTIRSNMKQFKVILQGAVKARLIAENPAKGQKCSMLARPDRMQFVTLEQTRQLLEACPDAEWRSIVGLARIGGLRSGEITQLRWTDINWENNRLTVESPKTAHHGKASRVIPLFPELRAILAEWLELAPDGAEFVISRYRDDANMRTQLMRIVRRSGIGDYGKPFQNLRASRETELSQTFPLHCVVKWLGNTAAVAQKHYLMVRDEDYERATSSAAGGNPGDSQPASVQTERSETRNINPQHSERNRAELRVRTPVSVAREQAAERQESSGNRPREALSGIDATRYKSIRYTPVGSNHQPSVP